MGRHSGSDDEQDLDVVEPESGSESATADSADRPAQPHRPAPRRPAAHAVPEGATEQLPHIVPISLPTVIAMPEASAGPAVVARPTAPAVETATHADLRLLRTDSALRARCIAAVIVPFAVYVTLMIVIGRTDTFLIWVWLPTVAAGVLVGSLLDVAHKRAGQQPDEPSQSERV